MIMQTIERSEVLGLADYETIRDRFRTRVIQEKKMRRVPLGDNASCLFENRDTILLQIQEMLRTERITRESAILHEIATYNQLIPGPNELSATIFIEIDDKDRRERFLREAVGLESSFVLDVGGVACPCKTDPSRATEDRTTAVHYVKFELPSAAEAQLRDVLSGNRAASELSVTVRSTHPHYQAQCPLPSEFVSQLAEDLA
jgi:hypothetical protein